ncbi:PD-(D/E)XK nuclease family protein [Patiriisocius sp. Uisw_047]
MQKFLEETLDYLDANYDSLSDLTLILPSKRAGGFLLDYLKKRSNKTAFAPRIINIEAFIEEVANLKIVDNTQLLFKSYAVYQTLVAVKEKESFGSYSTWATTLLGDFNEIDRYLLDHQSFFNYLASIQDVNHWYLKQDKTPLIESYLTFWNSLPEFYKTLKDSLLKNDNGYQGLVNRKAAEEIEHYIAAKQNTKHIFIGFNALNKAEQVIMQELVAANLAEIIWDADSNFFDDNTHSVSLFMREYASKWKIYNSQPFSIQSTHFLKPKKIALVEASKNISQVKYVGDLLSKMSAAALEETAIILADEALLVPMLHSLPANVKKVNVTMGVPLATFPLSSFFDILLQLKIKDTSQIYYRDINNIVTHPFGKLLFKNGGDIITYLQENNIAYSSLDQLLTIAKEDTTITRLLFTNWNGAENNTIKNCLACIDIAKEQDDLGATDRAVLFQLQSVFKQLESLQEQYAYLDSISAIHSLYKQLLGTETLDFKGDAYDGLQIMGLLESRVLDFKNVIMTSVNEGTLPSGKTNASFITYDLKQQFELPKYTEKDAIYAYHFYHAIQRAENCTLLYNTHSDGINTGEKSRFIKQLEVYNLPNHELSKTVIAHKIAISTPEKKTVQKTEAVMEIIHKMAAGYLSPSALTSYIRNPLDFYKQRILRLKELEEVEETVAANTMGTIVHNTLENLYKPLLNNILTTEILKALLPLIENEVKQQFSDVYKEGDYTRGKNLIIYEVVKKFVSNFINLEIKDVEAGNEIVVTALEEEFKESLDVPGINFPVILGGKVDRIDRYNGVLRIIDYKTGKVNASDLHIVEWDVITEEYKYSKAFQVLAYATMYQSKYGLDTAEAGIISFKNLGAGFLKFATKPAAASRTKNAIIDEEVLAQYKEQLFAIITEILNPEIPFTEKEII